MPLDNGSASLPELRVPRAALLEAATADEPAVQVTVDVRVGANAGRGAAAPEAAFESAGRDCLEVSAFLRSLAVWLFPPQTEDLYGRARACVSLAAAGEPARCGFELQLKKYVTYVKTRCRADGLLAGEESGTSRSGAAACSALCCEVLVHH